MACGCKQLESQHGEGDCKCVHYREQFPECQCESESVSDHSPGVVQDSEMLIRAVFKEGQVDPATGRVTISYIWNNTRERGMSVFREHLISREEIETRMEGDPKNSFNFLRYVVAECRQIRSIAGVPVSAGRAYCVYDTAYDGTPSHADICQAVNPQGRQQKSAMLEIVRNVSKAFGPVMDDLAETYGT